MSSSLDMAKQVLTENETVLYGIFGTIACSGYFPLREFLNEFLCQSDDPCDQDRGMDSWQPFRVSPDEYRAVKAWWLANHTGAVEDNLGTNCWGDWVQEMLTRLSARP